jgi:hypothetical protein
MGWLRLDDAFGDHPKVIGLSDRAFRAHVMGLLYCARHLTDGIVPRAAAPKAAAVRELERAGLWTATRGGGWLIHDFLDYNPSKAETLDKRSAKSMAGAKGAASRWHRRGNAPDPTPTPTSNTLAPAKRTRPRDELFEALAKIENADLTALTRSARGKLNDATKQLRDIGATPKEVANKAAMYRRVHPTWDLTAQALVKHWPSLNGSAFTGPTPDAGLDDSWLFPEVTDA